MKYLLVEADTNDADYIIEASRVSDEDLDKLRPLFQAIKDFKPYKTKKDGFAMTHRHNFPWGDGEYTPREDLGEKRVEELYAEHKKAVELFTEMGYCPYGENGIHTIKAIKILDVVGVEEVMNK